MKIVEAFVRVGDLINAAGGMRLQIIIGETTDRSSAEALHADNTGVILVKRGAVTHGLLKRVNDDV